MKFLTIEEIYGSDMVGLQKERYAAAAKRYEEIFGDKPTHFFSAPGRSEICGNHTDHNHGCVLAAGVSLDIIGAASVSDSGKMHVYSEGVDENEVGYENLKADTEEYGKSSSLIKGMAAGFADAGYKIGGFNAYVTSQVIQGSGLSSSAAYEVIIGTIINGLFNDGKASEVEIAKMAQRAENEFFGKPSGLMDQMASSVGGLITIDFADTAAPIVKQVNYDFTKSGYALCIIDTHGSHANLTGEYAAIPPEMKSVANCFGKEFMREVTREQVMENIPMLREKCGDRAVLRALHFLDDNERVGLEAAALEADDIEEFLRLINESGNSSLAYLQNIFAACSVKEQGLSVALYLAKKLLKGKGACRVHGGGFAGTIQAFVPNGMAEEFKIGMEKVFGEGSCYMLRVRNCGGVQVNA